MLKFAIRYRISIVVTIAILILCFMDTTPMPEAPMTNFDKLVHFIMFTGLSGIVFFENTRYFKTPVSYQPIVLGSFLFPILLSGFTELGQEYISPFRTGDWWDFLYDTLGSFVGFAICLSLNKKLPFKRK